MIEIITISMFILAAPFALISVCHTSQQEEERIRQNIAAKSTQRNLH